MSKVLRLLVMAVVLNTGAVATLAAQTVLLKGAAPGESVEVLVNAVPSASGEVGENGEVRLVATVPPNDAGRPEMDARVYLDRCDKTHRVYITNRNMPAPARDSDCERREIGGIFWVRQRSTLVIDVSGAIPNLLLRQGSYNPNAALRIRRLSPRGLVLFGGGGWGTFNNVQPSGCGTVTDCTGDHAGLTYTAGAAFWVTRFLAAEASFLRTAKAEYEGGGSNFDFTHSLEADVFTVAGLMAAPIGPVRLYGKGGGTYHRAVSSTTQIQQETTIIVNDAPVTIPGGTQVIAVETNGWAWLAGGGLEGWVTPRFALYGEAGMAKVKGPARRGSDLALNERITYIVGGVRLKVF